MFTALNVFTNAATINNVNFINWLGIIWLCLTRTYGGGVALILWWKVETNLVGSERAAREIFLSPQSGMNVFPLFPDTKQR